MEFRSYTEQDKTAVIDIFRSNCPKYFDAADEQNLIEFLEQYADENFLVVEASGKVIGCGGHYTKTDRHGIAWTMFLNKEIGSKRLFVLSDLFYQEIERRIIKENKRLPILINTTQIMERWFNRYGFITYEKIKDGFGAGLDEYKMRKEL